jgi:hypothetical protein
MAQKRRVFIADDLDGSDASETIAFGLDGVSYEIDLNSDNAEQFRRALAPYIQEARRVGPTSRRRATQYGVGRERRAEIREWAKSRGFKVSERGRIPISVIAEYAAVSPGPDFDNDEDDDE